METKQIYVYLDHLNDTQRVFKLTKAEARAIRWFLDMYGDEQELLEFDNSEILEVQDF